MLKSPMPPVYVPRHQVVKAKSSPAKRRVHSSWIGQRTCVHQRQALGNPGCHEPTMIGDALCNTHVCSFLEVRYTWAYHIISIIIIVVIMIIMDHVLAWVYHSEFLIMKSSPTFWLVNPLLPHYSFTTPSPPAAQQKTPRRLGSIDGTPGTHQQLLWREKLPVRLRHRGDRFDGARLQGSGPQHG